MGSEAQFLFLFPTFSRFSKVLEALKAMDKNGDGLITLDELTQVGFKIVQDRA